MRLVCHIGTPKTGSTFIQNTFAENRHWLRKQGVIYPELKSRDANHITLFYAAHEGLHDFARDHGLHSRSDVLRFRETIRKELAQLASKERNADTILVSSENLTGNLTGLPGVRNLGDLLKPLFDDISIIVYVRRQDEAILSMYGEYMRRGFNGMSFDAFLAACLGPNSLTPYLYYRRVLSMWMEVFGKSALNVRLYDPEHLKGGDILSDFMEVVFEKPLCPEPTAIKPSEHRNRGLSAPALEFLRRMYPHIPNRNTNGMINPLRAQLASKIDTLPNIPRPRMSTSQAQKILSHFQHANTWLRETFFPDVTAPLFSIRSNEVENIGEISFDQFAAFSAHLLGSDD